MSHGKSSEKRNIPVQILLILVGFISLLWFIIRVIPKPSRALYPCQRVTFPLASAFVIWLIGILGSVTLFKRARKVFRDSRYVAAMAIMVAAIGFFAISFLSTPLTKVFARGQLAETVTVAQAEADVLDKLPAKVAAVRSDKADCSDIGYAEIENMIRQAVQDAGGWEDIISDGDLVVLKPNLVAVPPTPAPHFCNGKVTDPRILEITAKLVKEINPSGKVYIMESGATTDSYEDMQNLGYTELEYIDSVIALEWTGRSFDDTMLQSVSLSDEQSLYPDNQKPNNARPIYLHKTYFDADVIISVPVLKNHAIAGITGAVKNVGIGATPPRIYGSENNLRDLITHDPAADLHKWIHDFYACRPVDFVIMDGLQGLEYGPGGYSPGNYDNYLEQMQASQKNMRLILAGRDPVALDAIAGLMMYHDPLLANHLVYLHNDHYGIVDPARIELVGVQVPDVRKDFEHDDPVGAATKYTKNICDDYGLEFWFGKDSLFLSVPNPENLARMQVSVDGQKIEKYIIGSFDGVQLPLEGINVSNKSLTVNFEDRYLNRRETVFIHTGLSNPRQGLDHTKIYPNPASDLLNISFTTDLAGEVSLQIIDISGRAYFSEIWHPVHNAETIIPVNIEHLPGGVYFVQIHRSRDVISNTSFIKY
jgi:uncharacterized protein (DUF362 family)